MSIRPIMASLRSFDERATGFAAPSPLAILMFFFQLDGGRDAAWTFFAAYLVLLTGPVRVRADGGARRSF